MNKCLSSIARIRVVLGLICLFVGFHGAGAQDESLAPGINERFKQQPNRIRAHEGVDPLTVFKTAAIDHSAIPPRSK